MDLRSYWNLLKAAAREWREDDAQRLGAALAYYTVFSIPPLLVIAVGIAGTVFGESAVKGELTRQLDGMVGPNAAALIQDVVRSAARPAQGVIATTIGAVLLSLGAMAAFAQLHSAMNTIWDVRDRGSRGIRGMLAQRLLALAMVVATGFLLMLSLVASTVLSAVGRFMEELLPGGETALHLLDAGLSFVIVTGLFAVLFKVLPDARVRWSDVWAGAILTALLFTVGRKVLGIYIGRSSLVSAYGAAGSLVALLAWIYYSAQIFFFGAEFTQVYANIARRSGGLDLGDLPIDERLFSTGFTGRPIMGKA